MMKKSNRITTVLIKTTVFLSFILLYFTGNAQNVGINETGAAPDQSALLDLSSTNKGFLITRADTADISSPAFGLMTLAPEDSCLYMHNGETSGKKWISIGGVGSDCSCGSTTAPPSNFACGDDITDSRDGKTYSTVQIGNQCWMAENLNYDAGSDTWCYDENSSNCDTYGRLYTWDKASGGTSSNTNPSGVQGVCPSGWHLPSDDEWCEMENTVETGTDASCNQAAVYRGTNTGKYLKTSSWGGDNTSGFTALPGGWRMTNGSFYHVGIIGNWWSATEGGSGAWTRELHNGYSGVNRVALNKGNGYAVRCVRD